MHKWQHVQKGMALKFQNTDIMVSSTSITTMTNGVVYLELHITINNSFLISSGFKTGLFGNDWKWSPLSLWYCLYREMFNSPMSATDCPVACQHLDSTTDVEKLREQLCQFPFCSNQKPWLCCSKYKNSLLRQVQVEQGGWWVWDFLFPQNYAFLRLGTPCYQAGW
jgi:hypothetical protein